jgi:hypothetical protein
MRGRDAMLGPQVEAEGAIPEQKAYGLNMRTAAVAARAAFHVDEIG